jgi:hypothetical protein
MPSPNPLVPLFFCCNEHTNNVLEELLPTKSSRSTKSTLTAEAAFRSQAFEPPADAQPSVSKNKAVVVKGKQGKAAIGSSTQPKQGGKVTATKATTRGTKVSLASYLNP